MDQNFTSAKLRSDFLNYFEKQDHRLVDSSAVIPHDDPTLLFNNAGMNQFKDFFLGKAEAPYKAATTAQKCVRVGGKHNDLENVGHTRRHLTFFEMLGNFSFGDYFKKEAIQFAWELSTEVFGFDEKRIWPSVYEEDDEAFELWKKFVPEERIVRFGKAENFWEMGESGPCGPCSELLFDRGEAFGKAMHPHADPSGERFLEFWNLVFMQYNRALDGKKTPLPSPSIDTGAGLERVVMLKMNKDNVFETDILRALIRDVEAISAKSYIHGDPLAPAFQVIADHIRTLSFAIADGAEPSNEGRGYVLRKVLRRAVRYARQLGIEKPFLRELVPTLVELMAEHFHELKTAQNRICELVTLEEEGFLRTLKRGGSLLSNVIDRSKASKVISGDDAFKLKDTYGMPLEEVSLLAKDAGLAIDLERYQLLEEEARNLARAAHKKTAQIAASSAFEGLEPSQFVGYDVNHARSHITALFVEEEMVSEIQAGQEALIITALTPFYAQMGGQTGDAGTITCETSVFKVKNTLAPYTGVIAHTGVLKEGALKVGDSVDLQIDEERRGQIRAHHSATHLLHWALEQVLGPHIRQAGSLVDPSRLRFDFNHHKALSKEEIESVEKRVNASIRSNGSIETTIAPFDKVRGDKSVKQFFADKYDGDVRIVEVGPSKELCGGTHASALGELGLFKIVKESSVASGVRRIEAVCSKAAESFVQALQHRLEQIAKRLSSPEPKIETALESLSQEMKSAKERLKNLEKELSNQQSAALAKKARPLKSGKLLIEIVDVGPKELKNLVDMLAEQIGSGVVVIGRRDEKSCHIAIKVMGYEASAKNLLKPALDLIGGRGGGSDAFATGGGVQGSSLEAALKQIEEELC